MTQLEMWECVGVHNFGLLFSISGSVFPNEYKLFSIWITQSFE